jgi:hypothetical protein
MWVSKWLTLESIGVQLLLAPNCPFRSVHSLEKIIFHSFQTQLLPDASLVRVATAHNEKANALPRRKGVAGGHRSLKIEYPTPADVTPAIVSQVLLIYTEKSPVHERSQIPTTARLPQSLKKAPLTLQIDRRENWLRLGSFGPKSASFWLSFTPKLGSIWLPSWLSRSALICVYRRPASPSRTPSAKGGPSRVV